MGVARCCRWLVSHFIRPGDTPEDVYIKQIMFPLSIFLFLFGFYTGSRALSQNELARVFGAYLCAGGPLLFMLGVMFNVTSPRYLIDVMLVVNTVGLCVLDVSNAAGGSSFRAWSLVVLALDAALVFSRHHVTYFIIPFTAAYIAFEAVETVADYGLYELSRVGLEKPVILEFCDCAEPPCRRKSIEAAQSFLAACTVFLSDFYFTRGFSVTMEHQLQSIESAVAVSEKVAAALASYDLDEATKAIASGEHLPEQLSKSYTHLVRNLKLYRDYLPDALLQEEDGAEEAVAPPVARDGGDLNVGMVFTDIQASTALWEAQP
eukprot:Hpha_TRINITY_DN16254_c3_g5::TRINITY_DN16254_c3_g5_i1::g.13851::m.13851